MKLSEKLDGWINYLESIDAPKPPEPSIARDYPEAWEKLQKRRLVFKWTTRVMVTWIFLAVLSRTYSSFALELPPGEFSKLDIAMMFLAFGALLVQYIAGHFYCPRCKELFNDPDFRGVTVILSRPCSKCIHCGLLIGEKKVNEAKKKS